MEEKRTEAEIPCGTNEFESKPSAQDAEVEEGSRKACATTDDGEKLPDQVESPARNVTAIEDKQELSKPQQDSPTNSKPPADSEEGSGTKGVTNEVMIDMIAALLRTQERRDILYEALDHQRPHLPTTASLYCPESGHPHSQLLNFGHIHCHMCGQTLKEITKAKPTATESATSASPEAKPRSESPDQRVKHSVDYLDIQGNFIFSESQPKPFDLEEASCTKAKAIQSLAFEVHTALSTSLKPPTGTSWFSSDIRNVQRQDILNNPDISVSVARTGIKIRSPQLIELLRKVIPRGPLLDPNSKIIELVEPFQLIGHHSRELEAFQDRSSEENKSDDGDGAEESNRLAAINLGMLMKFTGKIYNNSLEEERSRHSRDLCTFRMLWLLFKPGTTVYKESRGKVSAHVVRNVKVDQSILSAPPERRLKPCVINLWHLDFDGRYVGRCMSSVTVGEFEGERQITSLKVYPTNFIDRKDEGKLRQQLEKRGRQWYELLRGGQVYHLGELPYGLPVRSVC